MSNLEKIKKQNKEIENLKDVLEEEILRLRQEGLSYVKISNYFADKGINISYQTIRRIYVDYYKVKGIERPVINAKRSERIERLKDVSTEEVVELRKKGLTYHNIIKYYADKGIKIGYGTIRNICESYYKEKNLEKPLKKGILGNDIIKLREEGLSYERISKYYADKGIKVSIATIKRYYERFCEEKNMEKVSKLKKIKSISDEEIIKLREERLSYREISKYYEDKGIKVSIATIKRYYEMLCKEKNIEKVRKYKKIKGISDEEIIRLRQEGLTYKEISNYYENKGIKIGYVTIRKIYENYYKEKEMEKTVIKRKNRNNGIKKLKEVSDEEIIKLREEGLTYRKISKYYADKGIKVSYQTIINRLNKNGKIKRLKDIPSEEIIKLREEGLTYERISKYYEDKGIKISNATVRNIYVRSYKEKGIEKPVIKRKNRKNGIKKIKGISDEEILRLRQEGLSYKKISKYYENKGIKVSYQSISNRLKKIEKDNKQESLEELNDKLNELLIKKEKTQELLQSFTKLVAKGRDELEQKEKGEDR